jgi:hypothetical protein
MYWEKKKNGIYHRIDGEWVYIDSIDGSPQGEPWLPTGPNPLGQLPSGNMTDMDYYGPEGTRLHQEGVPDKEPDLPLGENPIRDFDSVDYSGPAGSSFSGEKHNLWPWLWGALALVGLGSVLGLIALAIARHRRDTDSEDEEGFRDMVASAISRGRGIIARSPHGTYIDSPGSRESEEDDDGDDDPEPKPPTTPPSSEGGGSGSSSASGSVLTDAALMRLSRVPAEIVGAMGAAMEKVLGAAARPGSSEPAKTSAPAPTTSSKTPEEPTPAPTTREPADDEELWRNKATSRHAKVGNTLRGLKAGHWAGLSEETRDTLWRVSDGIAGSVLDGDEDLENAKKAFLEAWDSIVNGAPRRSGPATTSFSDDRPPVTPSEEEQEEVEEPEDDDDGDLSADEADEVLTEADTSGDEAADAVFGEAEEPEDDVDPPSAEDVNDNEPQPSRLDLGD